MGGEASQGSVPSDSTRGYAPEFSFQDSRSWLTTPRKDEKQSSLRVR